MPAAGKSGILAARHQRAIGQAEQRLAILIWARRTIEGSKLSAEDALDMLVQDEADKLAKLKGLRRLPALEGKR